MIGALTLALAASAGTPSLDGVKLGENVATVVRAQGTHPEVNTTDIGHIWTFATKNGTLRITTDDSGNIVIIDAPGNAKTSYSNSSAHPEYVAATAFPGTGKPALARGYRISAGIEAVDLSDPANVVRERFLGERDALARAGFIPRQTPPHAFKAPVLQHLGGADYNSTAQGVAYVRIAVDASGKPTAATIFVSSGDVQLDRIATANAMQDVFTAATLDGSAVPSVYFRRENFVITKTP